MRFVWVPLVFAMVACGDDGGADGTDGTMDLGSRVDASGDDAGAPDDGGPDAWVEADAGDAGAGDLDAGPPPRRIEIGTGQLDFEPLPADGTLELLQGAQGGVHLEVAAQLWGLDPMDLLIRYEGYLVETDQEVFLRVERALNADRVIDRGDHLVRAGDRLILDEALISRTDLVGQQVRIVVIATPPTDTAVTATAIVTVVDAL